MTTSAWLAACALSSATWPALEAVSTPFKGNPASGAGRAPAAGTVDFAYTAAFFEVVKAIQLAGKRVVIAGLNELNAALLEALGVNRYAILVRRKST